MDASIDRAREVMKALGGIKVPEHYEKVYKDECVFTFDTPFSEAGLLVNLKTFQGVSPSMLEVDRQRNSRQGLYLLQKFTRVAKELPEGAAEAAPTKIEDVLAREDKWTTVKEHSLLVVDEAGQAAIPLPCADLPMIVGSACEAVIAHQGATSMSETARFEEDQELRDSKYAKEIVQLPPTRKVSPNPKDWKCEVSGDTQNLWLNLSDGHIGGGRKFWDGTGGSNGALDHFNEVKAKGNHYPLVVKLGTITAQGADVYSYAPDEDNMVKDPNLAEHLAHWGIDVMKMEKTDKSMAELELEKNMNYDWSRICESGDKLVRVRGPGLVGLRNLGNSCYMNSSMQMMLSLPEVKQRYFDADCGIRKSAPAEAPGDLVTQVAKFVNGIHSERYAPTWTEGDDEDDPRFLVAPQMFRALIGKNHQEFSSGRQQDAGEYLQYFLEQLARAERTALGSRLAAGKSIGSLFEFKMQEKIQEDAGERRVKLQSLQQNMLTIHVKLEDAENLADVMAFREAHGSEQEAKKPKVEGEPEEPKPLIPLDTCLRRLAAPEEGMSFRGGLATKTTRLATMPRYLLVQMGRYYLDEKWMPTKLDCKVPMPSDLSLEHLRATGLQAGEVELPEDAAAPAAAAPAGPEADADAVAQLLGMGLPENAAKRACLAVQNAGAELAAGWYFEHMEDPDINDPIPAAGGGGGAPAGDGAAADPEAVMMLSSMGFAQAHVEAALKNCGNNAERAADWLFSHADDLDGAVAALSSGGGGGGGGAAAPEECEDGAGEYSLLGFVSHVGKHTSHGHYVCHMRNGPGGEWVIFDDQKVAKSESPPLDLGYMYLYRRKDAP